MVIVTYLPSKLRTQATKLFGASHRLVHGDTWLQVHHALRREAVGAVLFDPSHDIVNAADIIRRFRKGFPAIPLIAYTRVNPASLAHVSEWVRTGVTDVVFHHFNDDARLPGIVDARTARVASENLMHRLGVTASSVPPELYETLFTVAHTPRTFVSVRDIVKHSGIPRRTLDRAMATTPVRSAARFITIVKLARAFDLASNPSLTLLDIAKQVGYKTVRSMNKKAERLCVPRARYWGHWTRQAFLKQLLTGVKQTHPRRTQRITYA